MSRRFLSVLAFVLAFALAASAFPVFGDEATGAPAQGAITGYDLSNPPAAPNLGIVSPADGSSFPADSSVTLEAATMGYCDYVEFHWDSGGGALIGTALPDQAADSFKYTVGHMTPGEYKVVAEAYNGESVKVSDPVSFTVEQAAAPAALTAVQPAAAPGTLLSLPMTQYSVAKYANATTNPNVSSDGYYYVNNTTAAGAPANTFVTYFKFALSDSMGVIEKNKISQANLVMYIPAAKTAVYDGTTKYLRLYASVMQNETWLSGDVIYGLTNSNSFNSDQYGNPVAHPDLGRDLSAPILLADIRTKCTDPYLEVNVDVTKYLNTFPENDASGKFAIILTSQQTSTSSKVMGITTDPAHPPRLDITYAAFGPADAPDVRISAPAQGGIFTEGSDINLKASYSGPCDSVSFYRVDDLGAQVLIGTTNTKDGVTGEFVYTMSQAAAGNYKIIAVGTNGASGAAGASAPVSFKVTGRPDLQFSGDGDAVIAPGSTIPLSMTGGAQDMANVKSVQYRYFDFAATFNANLDYTTIGTQTADPASPVVWDGVYVPHPAPYNAQIDDYAKYVSTPAHAGIPRGIYDVEAVVTYHDAESGQDVQYSYFRIFNVGVTGVGAGKPTANVFNVKDYGAKGDGAALDTAAIQAAVDAASDPAVKGTVYFPKGIYRTQSIVLRNYTTMYIQDDAFLQASRVSSDWKYGDGLNGIPYVYDVENDLTLDPNCVLYGNNIHDVRIYGKGTVDGAALTYYLPTPAPGTDGGNDFKQIKRPQSGIYIRRSQNIEIHDITLRNILKWSCVLELSDNCLIDGMTIINGSGRQTRENDGIDLNTTSDVTVQNCNITTGDDAMCIKPQQNRFSSLGQPDWAIPDQKNVVFRNNVAATGCNPTKIGTGTVTNLTNVLYENITIKDHPDFPAFRKGRAAMNIESNDGSVVSNLTYRNFTVEDVDTPIFIGLDNRQTAITPHDWKGSILNVTISNLNVLHSDRTSLINKTLDPLYSEGAVIQNINFDNVNIVNDGTAPESVTPSRMNGIIYPDPYNYGQSPAFGLFARDTDGLRFTGVNTFTDAGNSKRPMFIFENVANFTGLGTTNDPNVPVLLNSSDQAAPDLSKMTPYFADDFSQGMGSWSGLPANWEIVPDASNPGGFLLSKKTTTADISKLTVPGSEQWNNYLFSFKMKMPARDASKRNTGLCFYYTDADNRYYVNSIYSALPGGGDALELYRKPLGTIKNSGRIMKVTLPDYNAGEFYDVVLMNRDGALSMYLDGARVISAYDTLLKNGTIALDGAIGTAFGGVRVYKLDDPVLDTPAVSCNKADNANTVIPVTLNDNYITSINDANRRLIPGADYTLSADGGAITFLPAYTSALADGAHKLAVNSATGYTQFLTLNVSGSPPPAPTGITMSAAQTSLNMKVGTKLSLQITVSPPGADPSVTWSSSNPAVATVDPVTGQVTALKTGSVRITVKSNANPAVSYMFLVMINA